MKKVEDFLEQLGLTEIESKLYIGLLKTGPTTVKELSDQVGIKRITTHFNVETLIKKGLITQLMQGARRRIIAEPPDRLQYLLEKKVEDVKNLQKKIPEIIKTIRGMEPSEKEDKETVVKYYEGKRNIQLIYMETLKVNEVHSFADLAKYYEVFPGTINVWEEALVHNPKRIVWDILVDSPTARKIIGKGRYDRYKVKFLPRSSFVAGFGFADYIIYDDKVAIIQLEVDNPKATIIESKNIALSLKTLHRTMWNLLPA